jgi:uncharacterized FlaG/YvyC family protein
MNIESQSATLMPVAPQAVRAPEPTPAPAQVVTPAPAPARPQRDEARENARRIALAEKMVGANKSLIIEKDSHRVGFVYKTVDKQTGEVVRVWPQREVASALLALADPDARAVMSGMMIDAKA